MTAVQRERVSYEEFLEIEESTGLKHEFESGELFAMTGGSPNHAVIASNLSGELRALLKGGPCGAQGSELRVFIASLDRVYYPDASVVCGQMEIAAHDRNAVVNPVLVGEVMSPESRDRDLGTKATTYRQLPSVQEILLVDSEERLVVHQQRQDDGSWRLTEHRGAASIALSLGVNLDLDELYDRTGL